MRMPLVRGLLPTVLLLTAAAPILPAGPRYGVYLRLVDAPLGAYEQMSAAVAPAVQNLGWPLLATYDVATGGCQYKARVFVVQAPSYAAEVLKNGPRAAFAIPLRLAVFQDEQGTHLAVANPQNLARTIVGETFEGPPAQVVAQLRTMTASGFPGKPVAVQYGQMRDQGLIEKTMGIMAGGPFAGKIDPIRSTKATAAMGPREVADRIMAASKQATGRWGIHSVYRLDLPEQNAVLIGLNGDAREWKAFGIVGPGLDETRKSFACPGIDHAAAFPVELLVVREGDQVRVLMIDEMFRMKIYFEDAGKMKFAANMQMPGSIEDEMRDLVDDAY